jgi:hypothetical protein
MFRLARHLCAFVSFLALVPLCVAAGSPPAPRPFPIDFEANRGQAPSQYRYLFHRDGLQAMFLRNAVDFAVAGPDYRDQTIHLAFVGANAEPDAQEPLTGHSNYFFGNDATRWIRNVSLYSDIRYSELYRGISLDFYGNGQELEHDFRVDPGADPSQIAFRLGESSRVELSPSGDIEIHTTHGLLRLRKPIAYQTVADERHNVDAKFLLSPDGAVRFAIGSYDTRRPLVIDPVFVFSTYLGGTGSDQTAGVTADASGNILVIGTTTSTDFPTSKPYQSTLGSNNQSVFVSKFDPSGKTLIYSTYFGGSSQSLGAPTATGGAIAVDAAGDAIIAGLASSADIPQAGAIVSPSCQINGQCFFLASISADGSKLNYSGLIGGGQGGYTFGLASDLALDASGNAYLTGTTDDPNFTITPGTLATSVTGYPYDETFVLKVDPTGKLLYSTVIPGTDTNSNDLIQPFTNSFTPTGIAVNASGDVTIAGTSGLGLPTTAGVVGSQFPNAYVNVEGPVAGFLLQLNPTASAINFASYLPGTDYGRGLGMDSKGNFYVTGGTQETNLPVSANAYQKTPVTTPDGQIEGAYVMVLNPQATAVVGATYLGSGVVGGYGFSAIALDSHDNIFVGGYATSQGFPLLDPFVTEYEYTGSIADMVLAELSPDLSSLEFSTYVNSVDPTFGGSLFAGIAVDKSDHLLATGITNSRNFPTTQGSFEPQLPPPVDPLSQPSHSFVTVIDMSTPAPAVCLDTFSVNFGNVNANTPSTQTFHVTNCGNAPLNISSITSSDPTVVATQSCATLAAGAVCPVTLTFSPVTSNSTGGTVTLVDNAVTIPQTVSFNGQGIAPKISTSSNPLSFGHVLVGTPAVSGVLPISNQGQAQLSISSVSVSGAGFTIVNNGCTQPLLATYGFCSIALSFAPAGSGTQAGSVLISSNDPVTPQLTVALTGVGDAIYAVPSITSIGAPTVLINNGPVTLTINGANFYPQSVAQLNGVALATTFQSNNQLQAVIPASSLTAIGEQYLTVVNPLPGGGVSASVTVTPYQTLVIQPSALVSVPVTGMLYAAIPASAPANPNTVIPINPATGTQGTPIAVGNGPSILAASSDGAYLFVANQTDLTVQRINLTTNAVERTFPYTPNIYCSSCTTLPVVDLETVPGSPQEVLLSQGSILSLFNDAGLVNYVPGPACCFADPDFGSIALAGNPLTVYGLPFSFGGGYFQTANLSSSGLQYTRPTGYNGGPNNTTGASVISDGTLLYTSAGQVWNPATQTEVGTFPVQIGNAPSSEIGLALDTTLGQIYSVGQQTIGDSVGVVVSAYGMQSYALTGSLAFPQFYWPTENHLVRWGTNGLAFIGPGVGLTDQEVYILRSSVVSSQAPNPTPTLAAISPASANAGGPEFTLNVNGTGFMSTSVVEWNGTALSTSYVSAQQLTASVPSSDIASVGSAQIAIFNPAPGGGSSAVTDLTIVAPVSTTSSLSIAPAGALAVGTAYTLTVAVTPSSGNGIPTGNVVFTIGSATQTEALNASGIATFSGTVPAAAGSLSISAAYQGAPGFLASTSNALNQTVVAVATTTSLAASSQQPVLGAQVTLTAKVTPASGTAMPSGSVSFYNGSSLLATETLNNGNAVLNTSALPTGSNQLTASYAGTSAFAASNSSSITVAVNNPLPVIASLSPSFVSAGGTVFTLTIFGSGFTPASTLYWGSTALATQYTSATQLTAQVMAAEIASAGITSITVQTPTPGGGTSNLLQFEVDSAASGSAGAPSFTASTAVVSPGSTASYPVTLPSSATDVSISCLNLPASATCTYSEAASAVTITTSATTPAGTYPVTIVFTETLPGAATAMLLLPVLLLPLLFARKQLGARRSALVAFVALALALTAASGCGGSSPDTGQTQPPTHVATSSGVVTLTVQ